MWTLTWHDIPKSPNIQFSIKWRELFVLPHSFPPTESTVPPCHVTAPTTWSDYCWVRRMPLTPHLSFMTLAGSNMCFQMLHFTMYTHYNGHQSAQHEEAGTHYYLLRSMIRWVLVIQWGLGMRRGRDSSSSRQETSSKKTIFRHSRTLYQHRR